MDGYKKLKIYAVAHKLANEVHQMTLLLPKFELYEEGSQIRRSSKSVSANIVEGYSLRTYKADYIRSLIRAYAECRETQEHIKILFETGSLKDEHVYEHLV